MNDKKMACVLLLACIGGMIYGTQQMYNKATAAREAATLAEEEANNQQAQLGIAEMNLTRIQEKTRELRKTYEQWTPFLNGFATSQDAEAQVSEIIRGSGVFLISQRFETKEREKGEAIPTALTGSLVFEDDYIKTMNFLGKLEQSLPALRVTNCRMIRGDRGNNINLELTVELPIVSQPEDMESPSVDSEDTAFLLKDSTSLAKS